MALLVVLIVTQIPTSVKDHNINVCREKLETWYNYDPEKDPTIKGKGWNKVKELGVEKWKSLKEKTKTCRLYLTQSNGR